MASHIEVLRHLRPDGGYVSVGDDYKGITFIEAEPFSNAEYEAAFTQVDAAKAQAEAAARITEQAEKDAARKAIFDKLGLSEDEAKLLLS